MSKQLQVQASGEPMTSEELFRRDIGSILYLTREEEQALIEQARAGDENACHDLVLSCLPYVKKVAEKYATLCAACGRKRIEYLDLVQIGCLTVLECLNKALAHPNPCGYLRRAAFGEIVKYCGKHASLITSPSERGGKLLPIQDVESLDAPLPGNEYGTLSDIIPECSDQRPPDLEYTVLYKAIETLPAKQQEVIVHHYGIECAPEDLFTLSCRWREVQGKPFKNSANEAYRVHTQALAAMRKKLMLVTVCA